MTLDRRPFDPAAVLEDTVRLIAPEIEERASTLRVAIAPEARRAVLGDALAFRQIATNLIGNALKFTDSGGIAVELGIGEAGALVLAVSDTGVGIDPAEHDRIFERFVQVDGASTRRVGGAGLGLAITRALVELKRGSIRVRSAARRGRHLHRRAAAADGRGDGVRGVSAARGRGHPQVAVAHTLDFGRSGALT